MAQGRPYPKFASEEEERDFWDDHDPSEYFTEPADVIVEIKRSKKDRMVSLRMDQPLHDALKRLAKKHDVPYQRLMRELLRQSVTSMTAREAQASRREGAEVPAQETADKHRAGT